MENKIFKGTWIQGETPNYGKEDKLYYDDHHNIILKNTFQINQIEKNSILRIACLGYYIVYINDKRVLDYELNSDWTDYTKCVYYDEYDITKYVQVGKNKIVIELGNGMYNPAPLKLFGKYNLRERLAEVGNPKVICDLVVEDTIILSSNDSWVYYQGPYLFNNLYLGERIDNNYCDGQLHRVVTSNDTYHFVKSFIPKIKRMEIVKPILIKEEKDCICIDFGEMIAGFIDLKVNAKKGQEIQLQYSERYKEGFFDFSTCLAGSVGEQIGNMLVSGGSGAPKYAIQTDTIICCQGVNTFTNKFTYHSFRYVRITGCKKSDIESIEATYVHTDLRQIGTIACDNNELNELYDTGLRTKLNNVHSVFEDCARERLGYGGDIVALATSNLYMFDLEQMYKKVIRDFRFEQTINGGIPETAPYMGIQSNGTGAGEGPLLWQLVYPYLVNKHYQYYGDSIIVKEELPYLIKHIEYLLSLDLDDVVNKCLGDHGSILICGQFRKPTPDKLFLGYCAILLILKNIIKILAIVNQDSQLYQQQYQKIKNIVTEKFLNEDGSFGEGTQTSYAFALYLQLGDLEILSKKFIDKIKIDNYKFNSGIFGMALSYEVLTKLGYNEVIEQWLLSTDSNTYLSMLSNGNKVLAELFTGEHLSLNHAMFASYQQWYYQGLGGILIEEDAVAFSKVKFKPYFSKVVNHYKCVLETKQGIIYSSWQRKQDTIVWQLTVPTKLTDYSIDTSGYQIVNQNTKDGQVLFTFKE